MTDAVPTIVGSDDAVKLNDIAVPKIAAAIIPRGIAHIIGRSLIGPVAAHQPFGPLALLPGLGSLSRQ